MPFNPLVLFLLLSFGASVLRAEDDARPPFPEEWDPNPLRFPYAADESQYLRNPPAKVLPKPGGAHKLFTLPESARRPVRVLLQSGEKIIALTVRGKAGLHWRDSGGAAHSGPEFSATVQVERRGGEFRVAVNGGRGFSTGPALALQLVPQNSASWLEVGGKPYRGNMEVYPDGAVLRCVNSVGMEDYLRGVVPLEMGRTDSAALEALKAQAVVARTYAAKRMLAAALSHAVFDVHASVQDQVYGGRQAEFPMVDRAVRETEGWIVTYADTLALCYYFSTCGGMTASRHEVWGGPLIPYLVSRPDLDSFGKPWCAASKYQDWTQSWSLGALAGIIRNHLSEAGAQGADAFGSLRGLAIRDRFADGRIHTLELQTDRGSLDLHGDKIRFALKPGNGSGRILESDRFEIKIDHGLVVAHGSGFGHGIGLCQMGALGRARAGQSCAQILEAYYPGVEIAEMR